jgi:hypothetical protein
MDLVLDESFRFCFWRLGDMPRFIGFLFFAASTIETIRIHSHVNLSLVYFSGLE